MSQTHFSDSNPAFLLAKLGRATLFQYGQLGRIMMEDLKGSIHFFQMAISSFKFPRSDPRYPELLIELGGALVTLFKASKQSDNANDSDLEDGVDFFRHGVDLWNKPGDLEHSQILERFAHALLVRHEHLGRSEDLEDAISFYRKSLALHAVEGPNCFPSFLSFACALLRRHQLLGQPEDVDESIKYFRKSLAACPPGDPNDEFLLTKFAETLVIRYRLSGMREDLEESLSLNRQALGLFSCDHPDHLIHLTNLSTSLEAFFKETGNIKFLEESIALSRRAFTLRPPEDAGRPSLLIRLGSALLTLSKESGKRQDLDNGIEFLRMGIDNVHPSDPRQSEQLGVSLFARYNESTEIEDLNDAISFYRKALSLRTHEDRDCFFSFLNLGSALAMRSQRLGGVEDLEEAISFYRNALTVSNPPGNPSDHQLFYQNFGAALMSHYDQSKHTKDLDDSIFFYRKAHNISPSGHPDRIKTSEVLQFALDIRHGISNRREDLEESISLLREVLSMLPPLHSDCQKFRINLADHLRACYEEFGKIELLEESVDIYYSAVESNDGNDNAIHSACLLGLAISLILSYEHFGRIEDMEDSVSFHRVAVSLSPPNKIPNLRFLTISSLATALSKRYNHSGRLEDLEEAITFYRHALTLHIDDPELCVGAIMHLGISLFSLYTRSGKVENLEQAIVLFHEALTKCPLTDPSRGRYLGCLSSALFCRYRESKLPDDLKRSVQLNREAVGLCDLSSPVYPQMCVSLAHTLTAQYCVDGRIEGVEESISILRNALCLQVYGSPNHSFALNILAKTLFTQYVGTNEKQHFEEIFMLYEQAANDATSFPHLRFDAAIQWATDARSCQHSSTLTAYTTALQLLGRCLTNHPNVEEQQHFLARPKQSRTLASDAASAALDSGKIQTAVEFLEQGRDLLWSGVGAYKHSLGQLRQVKGHKDLVNHFTALSADLERLLLLCGSASIDETNSLETKSFEAQMKKHRILFKEWEGLVEQIRTFEGFGDFLQPPSFESLQLAAAEGPVILVNISDFRSDAIILQKNSAPTLVTLSTIFLEDLEDQVNQHLNGKNLTNLLRYLWNNIVSPVVDSLTELMVPKKSRIWWCPTSVLCTLPLHAAGPYRCGEKNLPDIFISSYTSTLSALIRARSTTTQTFTVPKIVVVGQPSETLQRVTEEIKIIQQFEKSVNVLLGNNADHKAVLDALKEHSWVHLACHGHLSYGSHLTLLDLIQAKLPNAELAFLSSCVSAAGDIFTPDENIHLSAALQFCGFKSVVGTLWEMYDEDGPIVSQAFSKHMFQNGPDKINFRDSAEALNLATRELRKNKVPKERWVPFVHIGA